MKCFVLNNIRLFKPQQSLFSFLFCMTLLKLKIRCSTGEDYSIEIDDSKTVLEFKNEIEKQFNVPSSSQRLIYRGRILQDDKTCKEYGIQTEQTVHMVKAKTATSTPPSSAPAEPTTATTTPAAQTQPPPLTTSTTPPASTPNPSSFLPNLGFGANPYGLPMPPLGANAFSPANLQAQAQQLMQNPEMLRNLMNNPMVQSMLNNPEIMQNMVNQNPQMRQVMEEHPELAQVVNNPQLMQETMELMRNPETMQEILRSQDLAMRNLESIDGGTDALRRMYNDVAEPMMNAAADMNRTVTPTTVPSQPSSTLYNDAVPNPWGAGGTSSTTAGATGTAPPVFPPYFANMFGTAPSPVSSTLTPPSATTTTSGTTTPAAASPATTSTVPPAAPGATSSSTTTQPPPPLPPFGLGGAMPNSPDRIYYIILLLYSCNVTRIIK